MSETVRANIRRFAPEFSDVTLYPSETLDLWIEDAKCDVPVKRLTKQADIDRALAYYACHLMTQSDPDTSVSGGTLTKEVTGDIEKQFSAGSVSSEDGPNKYYGLYLGVLKKIPKRGPLVLNGQ